MKIEGPVFAILTPFDKNGDIDYGALQVYMSFLQAKGAKNIITGGTTGEFASLTTEERITLTGFCRSNFKGTIINNVSSCSTRECKMLMNRSGDYCDYFLLLPPFYYAGVKDRGIMEFFKEVLAAAPNPVLLYNFPRHTQVHIKPDMLRQLKEKFTGLAGIKDSGGDLDISSSFKNMDNSLGVYIGSDSLTLEALRRGFDGSVSGGGNALPEFPIAIHNNFIRGEFDSAERTQEAFNIYNSFRKKLQVAEITTTKIALNARIKDFPVNVRPPLIGGTPAETAEIHSFMYEKVIPLIDGLRQKE